MNTVSASEIASVVITVKTHYSAGEIAALRLPGLPSSIRGIEKAAARGEWPYREVPARGGRTGKRREYAVASLPASARKELAARSVRTVPAATATCLSDMLFGDTPVSSVLTDAERHVRDARAAVLAAIRRLQADAAVSQEVAMVTLLTNARAGRLDPHLDKLLRDARDKRGRKGRDDYPSTRAFKDWLKRNKKGDLAPKSPQAVMSTPEWAADFRREFNKPQKPFLTEAYRAFAVQWPEVSIHQVRRWIEKQGAVERARGRMLPRELKSIRPFVRRNTDGLIPGDIYTADGHTFDAEIEHPEHGRPFRPEISSVIDVATRKLVGWSVSLAESTRAVLDAQRRAFTTNGICATWYVDNGGGYKNFFQSDEMLGVAARIGFEIRHSLPYSSQARGLIERSHQTIWVRAAKMLPTYMGKGMDPEARKKVFKVTRVAMKEGARAPQLMAFRDFVAFAEQQVERYNNHPHTALPRVLDTETGKRRHQTPNEAWQAALDEGWLPVLPDADAAIELFRPYVFRTVARGEIRLWNNVFFSAELEEFHGERVRVGYDFQDMGEVIVRDEKGRLICTAQFEGNKRDYFPKSVIEADREKRAAGRKRRLEEKLEEVQAELNGNRVLEHGSANGLYDPLLEIPSPTLPGPLTPEAVQPPPAIAAEDAKLVQLPGTVKRPVFGPDDDADQFRWLVSHPHTWDALDAEWLLTFVNSPFYEDLLGRFAWQGYAFTEEMKVRALHVLRDAGKDVSEADFEVAAG